MSNPLRFLGRHAGASIAGGVAIAALAGGGIAYAATSSGTSSTASPPAATAPAPTVPPTTTPAGGSGGGSATASGKARAKAHGVRGTVTAINGSTWTIRTPKGASVTVTVTPQTQYGTTKSPATAATFTVGSPATVIGQRTGKAAFTATRVIVPLKPLGSGATTSTTAP